MKPEALSTFIDTTRKLEGVVPFMYLDVVGLVTCGTGNLIDSGPHPPATKPYKAPTANNAPLIDYDHNPLFRAAALLDWRQVGIHAGVEPADDEDPQAPLATFQAEWRAIKARRDLALRGGVAFASVASLRLTEDGIAQLFNSTTRRFEATLRTYLPDWDSYPEGAQVATMLMAWGLGPSFPRSWPNWKAAMLRSDFVAAAAECQSKTFSGDRNRAVRAAYLSIPGDS